MIPTASDKVDQLLAHGRWFSPSTPPSSTTKTGRHDIAEIFIERHIQLNPDCVARVTRRVPLVEHELLTLLEHLSSAPVLVGFVLLCSIFNFLCSVL